jgi:hypothetical protein
MMNLTEKMKNIWPHKIHWAGSRGKQETKKQPKDIWFFYLFLLTFTLGVRKVILYFPLKGAFNEYAGVYVYASDIFLCSTILVWIIVILYNKISILSSNNNDFFRLIHRIKDAEGVNDLDTQKLSTGENYFIEAIITYFRAILLGLIVISLFDHYLWDIWQGQVSFWLVCGILVSVGFTDCSTWNNLKYVNAKKCSTWNIFNQISLLIIPLLLVGWSWLSLSWSENQLISFYRSVKFTELYLLFIYVVVRFVPYLTQSHLNCSTWNNSTVENSEIVPPSCAKAPAGKRGTITIDNESEESSNAVNNVPRGTFNGVGMFFWVIIFVGVAQSLIGITQFILQHSIGLFWLKESLIGQNIAGVAKIIVNSSPLVRAYGLFPHPNILGGFLFFSIMLTLLYSKLFHVEQFAEQKNVNCSTWNNLNGSSQSSAIVPRGTIMNSLIWFVLGIQIIGIILSCSKSAILALLIALMYIIVPRGTICKKRFAKLFHVEQFKVFFGLGLVVLVGLFFLRVEFYGLFAKSFQERKLYVLISERIIADNPIIGAGTGKFILEAEKLFPSLEIWQYQPVHNVFLLIWSEWGIVGLVLFILFLWKLFHLPAPRLRQASPQEED